MAQLIQHKRGVLEDLSGVTPNKGELLVVTGSSISALADGLVFVGNHSDLTSVNKILTGSSSPDLSSYDAGVNGLPFYNTTDKNLQILRQDGNLDVVLKHTKIDFNSSNIVSSSEQIAALAGIENSAITLAVGGGLSVSDDNDFTLNQNTAQTITISTDGSNIVSSSAQISNYNTFLEINGDSVVSSSAQTIAHLGGTGIVSSSDQIDNLFDIDGLVSSSDQISNFGVFAELLGDGLISESQQVFSDVSGDVTIASNGTAAIGTGVIVNADVNAAAGIVHTKLNFNGSGIVSESQQVFSDVSGDVTIASNGTAAIGTGVIVNADINAAAAISHTKIDFGGSTLTSGSLNFGISGSTGNDVVRVGVDALTFAGTANEIETTVTDNQVAIGIVSNPTLTGNVIITGDLTVNGDTVQTNVTTMNVEDNIIELNYGGSATTGGIYVKDVTGGNNTSGSIIWDGTNDYWKAGAKDSEARVILGNGTDTAGTITKFSADGVITDSIITESGTTVTISNDLILSGLTANSFLVANASKQLVSVTTSTDGDILVSDGAGNFSATNTIDGGSF
jgi:hypothetical protein